MLCTVPPVVGEGDVLVLIQGPVYQGRSTRESGFPRVILSLGSHAGCSPSCRPGAGCLSLISWWAPGEAGWRCVRSLWLHRRDRTSLGGLECQGLEPRTAVKSVDCVSELVWSPLTSFAGFHCVPLVGGSAS